MSTNYDCIVMGGGPSGNTVAAIVAEAGFKTLIVEREKHPRFHIGESLMPETYWTLKRIGALEKMKNSNFTKKYSVQFVNYAGRESAPFYFDQRDPRDCSQTWQVLRSEFDEMMWKHAGEKGAELREQTRVLDVHMEGDRATGVRLQTSGGPVEDLTARVVVDATGQQGLIANKLGIRQSIPELKNAAVWGYFENAYRDDGMNGGATIVLNTADKQAWFWYIPLHDNVVSVGVVGPVDYMLRGRGTPEEIFKEEVAKCPAVGQRIAPGKLMSEIRVLREFSYRSGRAAGEGWVLVGDAFTFLDPIYSSGVFLALKSGELAGEAVIAGLKANDVSAKQLGGWEDDFRTGVARMTKLVMAYYIQEFSFGKFLKQYPHYQGEITDLLVGKVFEGGAWKVFDDMDPWIENLRKASAEQKQVAGSSS